MIKCKDTIIHESYKCDGHLIMKRVYQRVGRISRAEGYPDVIDYKTLYRVQHAKFAQ